jgi:endonuclease-3
MVHVSPFHVRPVAVNRMLAVAAAPRYKRAMARVAARPAARSRAGAPTARRARITPPTAGLETRAMSRALTTLARHKPSWNTTALTAIAEQTGRDPFRILIGCLLSLRTKDETTGPATARLFALADTPQRILRLPRRRVERAIYPVGFYRTKAVVLARVCRDLIERFDGSVPSDLDQLLTLHGVGRKTANLVVTFGFGLPGICVDTHVHRISNRLGYVCTDSPEQTEMALRATLPRRHWIGLNDLLVAFGQNLCTPLSPHCSRCPVARTCRRVGVERAR